MGTCYVTCSHATLLPADLNAPYAPSQPTSIFHPPAHPTPRATAIYPSPHAHRSAADSDTPEKATPLHSAALSCEPAVVEALLQAGADASAGDAEGRLPADLLPEGQDSKQVGRERGRQGSGLCVRACVSYSHTAA